MYGNDINYKTKKSVIIIKNYLVDTVIVAKVEVETIHQNN